MRRLEEKAGLPPASPLRPFQDPYQEFEQPDFQQSGGFDPSYGTNLPAGYTMEDTEAGFSYQDIFSGADHITRTSTSRAGQSTSADPFGKASLVDYGDDDDDDDDAE
jgi:hypothetical protein